MPRLTTWLVLLVALAIGACVKSPPQRSVADNKSPLSNDVLDPYGRAKPATLDPKPVIKPAPKAVLGSPQRPIPRTRWTKTNPDYNEMDKMPSIKRITVHHDALPNIMESTHPDDIAGRLESIRQMHSGGRGWADIGYHYVIDQAGNLWEARPVAYQGAHVKDQNENNLGILMMGNFNQQKVPAEQVEALEQAIKHFQKQHKVKSFAIYTHGELGATSCPGHNLQAAMDQLRKTKTFK